MQEGLDRQGFHITVTLSEKQKEPILHTNERLGDEQITVSKSYLDYLISRGPKETFFFLTTILFLDGNRLISSAYYPALHSSIIDAIFPTNKGDYGNTAYELYEQTGLGVFSVIYRYYQSIGKPLEDVVMHFVNNVMCDLLGKEEFRLDLLPFVKPYYCVNEHLFNEIQSLCLQWHLFTEYGSVDARMIGLDDFSNRFDKLKSLVPIKYLNRKEAPHFKQVCDCLFSYGGLPIPMESNIKAQTFAELVSNYEIKFDEYAKTYNAGEALQFLSDENIIAKGSTGIIEFVDPLRIKLCEIAYQKDCLPYSILNAEAKKIADEWLGKGYFSTENELFSKHELDYLSYIFDDKLYSNAKRLRNKYEHGSGKFIREKEAITDYFYGLKALCEIISKFYDELSMLMTRTGKKDGANR